MANAPARAVLIPMDGEQEAPQSEHISVQFNPATLQVSLANTLQASTNGGKKGPPAQFVSKSESSLTVELVFDTTVVQPTPGSAAPHADVRLQTQKIATAFMDPRKRFKNDKQPRPPRRCKFVWGSFVFTGMVASYGETLDFFSPEGVPLRARLALTFKEDRFQFEVTNLNKSNGAGGTVTAGGSSVSVPQANQQLGREQRNWRETALFNGVEQPRSTSPNGVAAAPGAEAGGNSSQLGTGIRGAFA